ncbi:MAG: CCC motif membrane protein [Bacteroidales bacterium]|nr:CCC motif membrane protein [Bacteroidales bacterium]
METQVKSSLPNAQNAYILGIISIVLTFTAFIIGLILGVVAILEGNRAIKIYEEQPDLYDTKEYENAKTGKLLGWISVGLSTFFLLIFVFVFIAIAILSIQQTFSFN